MESLGKTRLIHRKITSITLALLLGAGGIRLGEGPDGENTAEPATDIEAICTLRITLEDLENALPNL